MEGQLGRGRRHRRSLDDVRSRTGRGSDRPVADDGAATGTRTHGISPPPTTPNEAPMRPPTIA
ncbi:hypothetical protein PAI11_42550 [Patulibacter medicamentivorans]|uniref:Uncharacterized protein n=1 Tax=Patulibacter medicamentivorans TaxID=1097667 RepID=H0EBM3_9ACTN|nr:hypothetical protein PAI11_42550 [Patulibacter medicamentivorans]